MKDVNKTREQLLIELAQAKEALAHLEQQIAVQKQASQTLAHRTEAEQALTLSDERFRSFVAHSTESIWCFEYEPPIPANLPPQEQAALMYQRAILVECNDTFAQIYGRPRSEDLIGLRFAAFNAGGADLLSMFEAFVRNGYRTVDGESEVPQADGTRRYYQANAHGIVEEGLFKRTWGTDRDITSRKQVEMALRESEERQSILIGASPIGIVSLETEGQFGLANPAFQQMLGMSQEELIGKTLADVTYHEDAEDLPHLWQGLAGLMPMEKRFVHKDGSLRWGRITVAAIRNAEGQMSSTVAVIEDITERKQAQKEREDLFRELEIRNTELEMKNAELERFTYTVSHDLKSPLVTIKGFLGLLEQDVQLGDTDRVANDVAQIANAADKMSRLLNELLDLSRIGRLINAAESISLSDLAREAAELVAGQLLARDVLVEVDLAMPQVYGDRIRLLEVYQNLIDNAVKFMGDQPEPRIVINAHEKNNEVLCCVQDNGIGIARPYQDKIFGLFERLNHHIDGTGIGLALVKRIIEFHGGRIWVESEGPGQGTTFYFTLPRME